MADLLLGIGGLRASIVTDRDEVAALVRSRYEGFLADGVPEWRVALGLRPGPLRPLEEVVVTRTPGWRHFVAHRYDFTAEIDLEAREIGAEFFDLDEFSLDSFIRVAWSLALVDAGGVLIHAASLVRDGRAYLFPGPSGSGKTTLARLSPDATLLSDELSIVRLEASGPRCYGTPFWGDLAQGGEACGAPLAGMYFLRQAERPAAKPVPAPHALPALLRNVMFFAKDRELTGQVLRTCEALVRRTPCFELSFRLDPDFWHVISAA